MKTARSALFSVRAKWRNIGIELEIDIGTLDSIEKSFHFDHTECLSRMLENWVKQTDPPPSWDALVEALESGPVGEGHLAEQIEQKYCSMSLNGHVSGKSECVPSSLAVVDVPQKSFLATTACASEYVKYLKALYTSNKLPLDNKWPPTPSKHYINLAFIDKQRVSRHEADEFTRYTIKGNIDDICQKKAPITIEKVACMQEVPFAYDPSQVEVSYPKLIVITGAPGIGKSTFAWELCRKWGNGELLQHYSLVILLRLRDKNVREAGCLADVLFQQRRPLSESLATEIEQCNGEGVLFLLEGFDELPQSLRVESSLYLDLIYGRLLPLATVLVTSRPWAISDLHWKAKDRISQQFEILGFTKQQIDEYLISVTLGDSTLLDELRRYVSLNPPIHAAMYIPLNAAIVFEVYKDRRDRTDCVIPNTMTELYTAFSLTLLIRYLHDQGEIMRKVDSIKSLPSILYKKFLGICELAFKGLKDGQFIFSDLPSGFETLGFMQSIPELHFSSGISISYNFLHLTVQEFLAAYYLSLQRDIGVQIHDESVTRFLAGITKLNNPAILPKQLPKYSVVVKASSLREVIYDELPEELPHGALRVVKTHETNVVDYVFVEYHVHLGGSTLFYESQNKAQLEASIGIETAFLEITSRMTPMECFAAGWCIGNTVCKWKLCFNETFGSISPDCMEMLHAGIRKCSPSSRSEVCELDIRYVYGSYDSLEIFFNLWNVIPCNNIKRFVCLNVTISSQHVAALFCTQIKRMMCLEEVILDNIQCGSMEANAILDVACGTAGSLKLGDNLSEHFIKRSSLMNSTIHSLSLHFSSIAKLDIKVTDVVNFTTALLNCKSLKILAIHGYPFYIHGMLLEQLVKHGDPCSKSDPENVVSYAHLPHSSGEIVAHLLQGTSSLTELILRNCGLGQRDTAIITQAVKHNKLLLTLDLSDNNCSRLVDAEVDPFADMLRANQTLQVLRLCGSKVDTYGMFKVLANNENTNLLTLDVRDNYYSVRNLQDSLMNNRSLQRLHITIASKHYYSSLSSNADTAGLMAAAYTAAESAESETIYSLCSAVVTALSNNTRVHELTIHTTHDFYNVLVCIMQQRQGYEEIKKRIKLLRHCY